MSGGGGCRCVESLEGEIVKSEPGPHLKPTPVLDCDDRGDHSRDRSLAVCRLSDATTGAAAITPIIERGRKDAVAINSWAQSWRRTLQPIELGM